MYSNPDIVGAFIGSKATNKSINKLESDWSYSLRIEKRCTLYITSKYTHRKI